ncbi:DNA-directed RNA polymerase, partial [Datura stramonium]|nr:DNA-directed RNA polymerase [Datura stramonium]
GENYGLVKNLASMGLVRTTNLKTLLETLFRCRMQELVDDSTTSLHGIKKVLLDGDWVGVYEDSTLFVSKLRRKRYRNEGPHQTRLVAEGDPSPWSPNKLDPSAQGKNNPWQYGKGNNTSEDP